MAASYDVIVIGAGIAGMSVAAELAADARVVVLEAESQPGYHATGRSAAYFAPPYGNSVVQAVTRASESFFRSPPTGFSETALLRPRGSLFVGQADQSEAVAEMHKEHPALVPMSVAALQIEVPILNAESIAFGLFDATGGDLDVDALLQGYRQLLGARGGGLVTSSRALSLRRSSGNWIVETGSEIFSAPILVNAAGAWADEVASRAGLSPLGLIPKRRTVTLVNAPPDVRIDDWPLVIDVDERFYFKPDAGQLLISPADETPSPPCDAQPDEMDIAIAIDRFMAVTDYEVPRVNHRWAGLRTFAPDKSFVVGFDPRTEGFFWLAGQGGYGVQSAPGLSRLGRSLIIDLPLSPAEHELEVQIAAVAPDRLL